MAPKKTKRQSTLEEAIRQLKSIGRDPANYQPTTKTISSKQCFAKKLDILNTKLNRIIQIQVQEKQQYQVETAQNKELRTKLAALIRQRPQPPPQPSPPPPSDQHQLLKQKQQEIQGIEQSQAQLQINIQQWQHTLQQNHEMMLKLQRNIFVLQQSIEDKQKQLACHQETSLGLLEVSRRSIQAFRQKQSDHDSLLKYQSLISYKIKSIRDQNDRDLQQTSSENHIIKSTYIKRSQVKQHSETKRHSQLISTKELLQTEVEQKNGQLDEQRAMLKTLESTLNSYQNNDKALEEQLVIRRNMLAKQVVLKQRVERARTKDDHQVGHIQAMVKRKNLQIGEQDKQIRGMFEQVRSLQQRIEQGISDKYFRPTRQALSQEKERTKKKGRRQESVSMSEQTTK